MTEKTARTARDIERRLPLPLRRLLRRAFGRPPPPGGIDFGDFRRLEPIDPGFGYDRGTPVDRHYIEDFLARHAADVRGEVLEVGEDTYTRAYGGERVTRRAVLHVSEGNPAATYVGDLATADHLPSEAFDCVILTQTLHLIYDFHAALRTLRRILRPGGVLLATVPGITQIDRGEWGDTWYWSFTAASVRRMFTEDFGAPPELETHGNVLAAVSFLQGVAAEELQPRELAVHDAAYPVIIAVRAMRPATAVD